MTKFLLLVSDDGTFQYPVEVPTGMEAFAEVFAKAALFDHCWTNDTPWKLIREEDAD